MAGGYGFAAGLVALVGTGLPRIGIASTESATLGGMVGPLACLAVMIWLVASGRPLRATVFVIVSAALMIGAAAALAPHP